VIVAGIALAPEGSESQDAFVEARRAEGEVKVYAIEGM
jgi:hypothetical protein